MIKINEIYKKIKITPNLSKEFQIMWGGFTKKMRQKNFKKLIPRVPSLALGEGQVVSSLHRTFPDLETSGRGSVPT
jgi:hypothetical protein